MPGVLRPMNLVDVLGTINDQSNALLGSQSIIDTLGAFAEADETLGAIDSATTFVIAKSAQHWDGGVNWGAVTWN